MIVLKPTFTLVLLAFFLVLSPSVTAQYWQSYRTKKIKISSDTTQIDSVSIVQGSFKILQPELSANDYTIDYWGAQLIWKSKKKPTDSLLVAYRVFSFSFAQTYQKRKYKDPTTDERGVFNPFVITPANERENLFKFDGLQRNGSISRGVAFGNNQDLAVNSSLNLQLSGKLTPDIEVNAAITDDNIPIQPAGNTQQLQDFDKVFIQLRQKDHELIVGDFQITRPESYFMNFNKRLQGIGYTGRFPLLTENDGENPKIQMRVSANAAIARGRFHRMNFQGVEGNQGPYRLRGANNEQFIIVLSGSEKVYVDGRQLTRGQENDYIIDYNTAEIIFTTRNLMTKDLRIFVEFEYSERNYTRSLLYFNQEFKGAKWATRFNLFSEQDAKNQPVQQQLTDAEKLALQNAGDNLSLAVTPSVDSVGFQPEFVLYELKDSLVNGFLFTNVLVYSTNPEKALYRATFSQVGAKQGNYIQIQSAANGRVFQWVAPVNGSKQGNFEPVRQLIPPTQKRLLTFGNDLQLTKNLSLNTEVAYSYFDQNSFSDLDAQNNQGYAFRTGLQRRSKLGKDTLNALQIIQNLSYEQVDVHFVAQERWRNVEFDRDWNLTQTDNTQQNERIGRYSIRLSKNRIGVANYQVTAFNRSTAKTAFQHSLNTDLVVQKIRLNYVGSLTQSRNDALAFSFYRHKTLATRNLFNRFVLGYRDEFEQNLLRNAATDTLLRNAYRFFDRQVFLQQGDSSKWNYNLSYRIRTDEQTRSRSLTNYATAEWYSFAVERNFKSGQQLRSITTWRVLNINDSTLTTQKPENTLVNRIEFTFRALKGVISGNSFYETGSGLESRKEFSYLQVPAGQGTYAWIDYNENGIRELNEFELAAFPDQAQYIRVFIPTNEFIRVFSNQFNETVNIKAPTDWRNRKSWQKLLFKLSAQSAFRTDARTQNTNLLRAYNPFQNLSPDDEMVTVNNSFRNTLFVNRNGAKFGIDFNWQVNTNRAILINGIESRNNRFSNHRLRWNITDRYTFNLETRSGEKSNLTELFSQRNFEIRYIEGEPKISWQPNGNVRISFSYRYSEKKNNPQFGTQQAYINAIGFESKYNVASKGSFQGRFNLLFIQYNDVENTALAFEMLESLRSGRNATWGLSYQRALNNNMQLNLNYDGRQSTDTKMVHIGSVQVRAFF